jgi:hypothetical protein
VNTGNDGANDKWHKPFGPNARVRSVRCVEENESRLECTARLAGADREQTQLDVVGAPDDYVWEEAN